jgi:hypothetical protein
MSPLLCFCQIRIRIRIRIRILRLIFWHEHFLRSGSHCFHMYAGTCKKEKSFAIERTYRVGGYRTFCEGIKLWTRIRIPNFLFGSGQNLRNLSNSDPQHFLGGVRIPLGKTSIIPVLLLNVYETAHILYSISMKFLIQSRSLINIGKLYCGFTAPYYCKW